MPDSHITTLPDGRELGWSEYGDPNGWPIFGFHGTPGTRRQLCRNDADPANAGVRLITLDRPGYGLSTFQPNRRLVDWPADVAALADHLGIDRFSVVGVSGGGPHSLVCAALLPERVVTAGVVCGAGPVSAPELKTEVPSRTAALLDLIYKHPKLAVYVSYAQLGGLRLFGDRGLDLFIRTLPPADAEIANRPEIRADFKREVATATRTTARAQVQDLTLFSSDWGFDLAAIHTPVVFWQGDADKTVPPAHAYFMHERVPGSVLHIEPGAAHLFAIDHLERILKELVPA